MLRIGQRSYDLVLSQSGFSVTIGGRRRKPLEQMWMLDAHYVPAADDPGRDDGVWEYWRLTIHHHGFQTKDWRELASLHLDSLEEGEGDPMMFNAGIENLLAGNYASRKEDYAIIPGMFRARRTGGYMFMCEFDGFVERNGQEEEFKLLDELPFSEVLLYAPINAADPVASGRAIAAREIKLTEIAAGRVTPPDWRREQDPAAPLDSHHQVVLGTPWRK